jgi:hypothetical protein
MRLATFSFVVGSSLSIGCAGGVASSPDNGAGADASVGAISDSGVASPFADAVPGASDALAPGSDGACDPTETINAESYDQACTKDSDCVPVGQGNVCDPCLLTCTTTAINARALKQFLKDLVGTPAGAPSPRAACSCAHSAGFAPCCQGGVCRADVSCLASARSDSGSDQNASTVADAQTSDDAPDLDGYVNPPLDGPLPPVPDAANCAGALVLHLGDTIQGTTCGGSTAINGAICSGNNPAVFVFVDAPDGVAIELTPSLGLSVNALDQCDSLTIAGCGGAPYDPPDVRLRFFAVARLDTTCGDFSLSVRAR